MKILLAGSLFFFFSFFTTVIFAANDKPLAFPGADGYGKYTTGGRGGRIITVTNLNDSGSGSLREAIEAEGARIVIFNISGTIFLKSDLTIANPDITIAGQSAPGDGICVGGEPVHIKTDNVVIRFMRFRLGDITQTEDDALNGTRKKDIIIDHCSLSWSVDETGSFYDNENFTLQWCILSESLYHSAHKKGNHGYGGIWGGKKATFHHNLLAHHSSRNPRFCGARYHEASKETELVDFRNNVIYNWGFNSSYAGENAKINMVSNYYKPGPATKEDVRKRILEAWQSTDYNGFHDFGKFYIEGNIMYGNNQVSKNNWEGVDTKSFNERAGIDKKAEGETYDSIIKVIRVDKPFPYDISATQPAEDAYISVLAHAGASLIRDAIDIRIVKETQTGTATYGGIWGEKTGIIDSQSTVGGWPELKSSPVPLDSDNDGIPDEWEKEHNLNPKDPSDALKNTLNGAYNNIEIYLNDLVKTVIK